MFSGARAGLGALFVTATLFAVGAASAQQGGGHPDMQTVVLMDLVAERGPGCGTVAPWEAELLRSLTREMYDRLEPERAAAFQQEARERAEVASCDDLELARWPASQKELWADEELPKFLAAYRALALMATPPERFAAATGRAEYGTAVRAIDARFGALEAAGATPLGNGSWTDYLDVMARVVPTRAAADDAAVYVDEVARITELWLDEALAEG